MIAENTKAPDFTLPNSEGNKVSRSPYSGKWVLLVFYPGDNTPVCTTQLCSYRDNYTEFTRRDITFFAISTDTVNSHRQFVEKNSLPFTLLSDHDKQVSRLYDVMDFLGMSKRAYVLIDENGTVRLSFSDLLPLFYQSTPDLLAKIDEMKPNHP